MADEDAVASRGLSEAQIRSAMEAFVGETLRCAPEGVATPGTVVLQLRVGCDGRVAGVTVADPGGLPDAMVACVRDVLRFTPFPAHDLPDGEVFDYPLTFRVTP